MPGLAKHVVMPASTSALNKDCAPFICASPDYLAAAAKDPTVCTIAFFRTWIDRQYHSRIGRYAVASRNKGSERPLEDRIELFVPSSGNDRYLRN